MPTDNLPRLNGDPSARVPIQRTSLGIDVLGRFLCNTLDEALNPDREPSPPFDLTANFDAIVIGSGMYGAYCATRLWRNGAKVLVLEAGPFLISEHYQNLSNVGLGTGGTVDGRPNNPDSDRESDVVWGLPWRGNQLFGRLAFCVGGKSLFWGGWSPRLTDDVLDGPIARGEPWPPAAAAYLRANYGRIELQMGVKELVVRAPGQQPAPETRTDLFNDPTNLLTKTLEPRLKGLRGRFPAQVPGGSPVDSDIEEIEPAPIAIQANAPASGLFSFDKFSSLPLLVEAIREDAGRSGNSDQRRRLFIVPNVRTLKLVPDAAGDRVVGIEVADGRTGDRTVDVPEGCRVVLALSGIESTRLALESFGGIAPMNRLIGRNLMAHLRNNFTVRIRREALGLAPGGALQTSAFHIRCKASNGGRYHIQFYAGFQPGASAEAVLYRMIPDIESVEQILANQDPDWVALTFRGCGEMVGRADLPAGDGGASYINLSGESDEHGRPRAWVHLTQQPEDLKLFDEMDQAVFSIAERLAGDPSKIEYLVPGAGWSRDNPFRFGQPRFGKLTSEGGIRDSIGSTYHDSGTLWMGDDPDRSVTDSSGRFHRVRNVSCVDQAVFPRVGSANPVPTGLLIARRGAEEIADGGLGVAEVPTPGGGPPGLCHRAEAGFTPLLVFDRNALLPRGWRQVGDGGFARFGLVLESVGGIGALCHVAGEFADFTLRLQWRAPTIRNNAGVHVRLPKSLLGDPGKLIKSGYEVQIDNTGERPADQPGFPFPGELFNPFHQTGAIYPVHNRGEGGATFPADADLPDPNGHPSISPIPTRALERWNDLEILAGGNRLRVVLNGVPVLRDGDYVDRRDAYPRGLIGLQNHFKGLRVQFRHVRIREGAPTF